MTFYHILISVEPNDDKLISVFTDLSEKELLGKFVKPFSEGKNILAGNQIFPTSRIRKFHIVRTLHDNDTELQNLQKQSSKEIDEFNARSSSAVFIGLGRGYDAEDILETGDDVTSQYISSAPDDSPSARNSTSISLAGILNHPWIVSIGTGVIVAALIWTFGWN